MKSSICLILLAFLLGCAQKYVIPKETLSKSGELTRSEAIESLRSQLQNTEEQAGVCQVVTTALHNDSNYVNLDENANLHLTGKVAKVASVSRSAGGTYSDPTYSANVVHVEVPIRLNLTTVHQIRVKEPAVTEREQMDCPDEKGDIAVWLRAKDSNYGNAVILKISEKNFSEVLAALLALSPTAEVVSGVGL